MLPEMSDEKNNRPLISEELAEWHTQAIFSNDEAQSSVSELLGSWQRMLVKRCGGKGLGRKWSCGLTFMQRVDSGTKATTIDGQRVQVGRCRGNGWGGI